MHNFFVMNENFNTKEVFITGENVNHIKNVLRMSVGTDLYVTNIDTHIKYLVEIKSIETEKIICTILSEVPSTELPINITLFQGLPKFDKLELIIEKATELGVNKIVPVEMRFSIAKMKNEESKLNRWQKIAETAAKQSKRNIIPEVEKSIKSKQLYDEINNYDLVLIAYENEDKSTLKDVLSQIDKNMINNIAIVVGPEGGIDKNELESLIQSGAQCVSLGKRILRTETAPLSILSMLIYEFEL